MYYILKHVYAKAVVWNGANKKRIGAIFGNQNGIAVDNDETLVFIPYDKKNEKPIVRVPLGHVLIREGSKRNYTFRAITLDELERTYKKVKKDVYDGNIS